MKNVTAAILIEGGKILIARRKADDHLAFKWEFPGGKVEPGEIPEECLKREMKEEFNVEVRVGNFGASGARTN
jgi:8-oxo-dGTP diphosphatase